MKHTKVAELIDPAEGSAFTVEIIEEIDGEIAQGRRRVGRLRADADLGRWAEGELRGQRARRIGMRIEDHAPAETVKPGRRGFVERAMVRPERELA